MEGLADRPDARVRSMRAEDVDAIVSIESEAFTTPWSAETFTSLIDRPGLELLVLEDATAGVVGYAVLWCILDQGELANLAIAPTMRGRGLGGFLLRHVLDVGRERGLGTVYLEVRASNERAAGLYRRFGFSDVGSRPDYYDDPKEDARIMRTTL